jgi:hypothetical protein
VPVHVHGHVHRPPRQPRVERRTPPGGRAKSVLSPVPSSGRNRPPRPSVSVRQLTAMTNQPRRHDTPAPSSRPLCLALAASSVLALAVSACGAGHSVAPTKTADATTARATISATTPAPPPPPPRLRILSPRRGANAAQTLTVRVSLTGATPAGHKAFKYVLDGTLTRLDSDRLTYHDLAPGHHQLLVSLDSRHSVKASTSFTVPAPPPPPPPPSASATMAPAPAPMSPAPISQAPAPAPAPTMMR